MPWVDLGNGMVAHVCSRGVRTKACSSCGAPRAPFLCDWPLAGKRAGATCSRALCARCRNVQPAVDGQAEPLDYCGPHHQLALERAKQKELPMADENTAPRKTRDELLREDPARQARVLKQAQMEREIRESAATPLQKENMLHTLSKIGTFSDEHAQTAFILGARAEREKR